MSRHIIHFLAFVLAASSLALSQKPFVIDQPPKDQQAKPPDGAQATPVPSQPPIPGLEKRPKMSEATRMQIIQAINAEFARTRKYFPVGYKNITLSPEGRVKPDDRHLYQLTLENGAAAKVGDRIQITNIVIHEKSIYLEVNGGPKKKGHWYDHVSVVGMGGAVSPGASDPNQAQPTGSALTLEFKDHVPEMTGSELEQLLDPVFDFSLKTATEVYLETVPPKVKEAIKNHEVLVGMNHDMVVMAKDRPPQKVREKDPKGVEYEEWIYGAAPQDVTFVRFVGDEVTEVKIMKVSGEEVLKTDKEVDVRDGVVTLASATAKSISAESGENPVTQQSGPKPTLKRTGDTDDSSNGQGSATPSGRRPTDPTNPTDPSGMPPRQPLPPQPPN